jgi:hypothetical protein
MKATFSEFSYGYAITEELANGSLGSLVGFPVFPSLRQEGFSGGYDLQLPLEGAPLFLQFKLSDYLSMGAAKEWDVFTLPYYRMHIRCLRYSPQHRLLFEWQGQGNEVFYVAPAFHRAEELNAAYLARRVSYDSVFIRPSDIGNIQDLDEHYVIFPQGGYPAYLCSVDPTKLEHVFSGKEFVKYQRSRIEIIKQKLDADFFKTIVSRLKKLAPELNKSLGESTYFRSVLSDKNPGRKDWALLAGFLTRLC